MQEPGLDLHDWESRWSDLEEAAADEPDQTLWEMARLIRQMLEERGFQLDEPVTAEGEEPEIIRPFLAARETARRSELGTADPEEVKDALEGLRDIHDYLVEDRAPP